MNLPEYALKNARVVWFFLLVLLVGGVAGFATLGKKEDSTFVIKSASLLCRSPHFLPHPHKPPTSPHRDAQPISWALLFFRPISCAARRVQ